MSALNPSPPQLLADALGRPYFLWDMDLTLEDFQDRLRNPDLDVRSYFVAKLMRQAKPDDVFTFVSAREIRELWPGLLPYLGQTREFWTWLFNTWERQGHVWR